MRKTILVYATALALTMLPARAQGDGSTPFRNDTLSLHLSFRVGEETISRSFDGNGERIEFFRRAYNDRIGDEKVFASDVFIRVGASPEGETTSNIILSEKRAENVREFICHEFGISPFNVHVRADGESWDELATLVSRLDTPWRNEALKIIMSEPVWRIDGQEVEDSRKARLRRLDGGKAWKYLSENIFPSMRSAYGDATFVFSRSNDFQAESFHLVQDVPIQRDTVFVSVPTYVDAGTGKLNVSPIDPKFYNRLRKKAFLMGVRTNIVAVPLVNVGVEFPFGRHFSLGVDVYYPWLRRNDYHKECTQMFAYDMDIRYWFGKDNVPSEARLLGHSFGLYGAGGHYDIERNWRGNQGNFFNVGFDWMYAFPIFHGAMHMEIELGLGFIFSEAQPYYVYEPYADCFREPGVKNIIRWFGPTRAQISLVVPIYRKVK